MLASYPIEKIWQVILHNALEGGSLSIHIEPLANQTRVRYQTKEGLAPSLYLPKDTHDGLNKYLRSQLGAVQAGRGEYQLGRERIGLGIEFLPTITGEKIFIRLAESGLVKEDLEEEAEIFLGRIKNETKGLILFKPKARGLFEKFLDELRRTEKKVVLLTSLFRKKLSGAEQIVIKPEIGLDHSSVLDLARRKSAEIVFLPEVIRPELSRKLLKASQDYLLFTFMPVTRLEPLANWLKLKNSFPLEKDFLFLPN